ncbi:MAG: hypothetical protein KJ957_01585 [Candidatus Omnitrophica bacterium]|nr:hypothetical protein [Candidatus Omnitrophota bacterium]MBU1852721.1 hypothetical protein [Candidatus Omnitrophota bacterium]
MNPDLIRWIDKNLGRPFCFFLTIHRRLYSILKKDPRHYKKPAKILFIKLIEQGSTVLAYPALKKAKNFAGREHIFFLVLKKNRPILDILDIIPQANLIEVDSKDLISLIYSGFKALIRIRKEKIDAAIDMEFFSRTSAIISYLSGADKKVGLHQFTSDGPYRGDLFTHKLLYNPYLHASVFFVSLVEALNYAPPKDGTPMIFEVPKVTDSLPIFSPTEDEKELLIRKLEQLPAGGRSASGGKCSSLDKPIIILNPNTADLLPIRRWPEENFIKLGKLIQEGLPRSTILITGTVKEKQKADLIASKIGKATSVAGLTSLKDLLTLYSIADILVTNDSGPALFSSLTPVKAIILFGPETPLLYGKDKNHRENISSNLVCSPCVNAYNHRKSSCKIGACLRNITVENVYEKVMALL